MALQFFVMAAVNHLLDDVFEAFSGEDFTSAGIEDSSLVVHHLIVFEQALAYLEVSLFDFFLCLCDALADSFVIDRLAFFPADPGKRLDGPFGGEDAHQVVVEAEEELAGAGVTLPAGAAAELVVDSSGLVPFGAEDVQAADFGYARAEFDVGAAACHIRCDCYIASHFAIAACVLLAGFGDNQRLLLRAAWR